MYQSEPSHVGWKNAWILLVTMASPSAQQSAAPVTEAAVCQPVRVTSAPSGATNLLRNFPPKKRIYFALGRFSAAGATSHFELRWAQSEDATGVTLWVQTVPLPVGAGTNCQ